jgi:chromosome segregation ATPase
MSAEEPSGLDGRPGLAVDQPTPVAEQPGPSVGVVEAAGLLGQSPDAIVSALQRHALQGWCDERGEWRVAVAALSSLLDGRDVLGFLRDQLDRLQDEVRQARAAADAARRQAEDRQAAVADLRVALARAEERIKAVEAVAIADVATAQAEAAAKDQVIAELRAITEWHRSPWWEQWARRRKP